MPIILLMIRFARNLLGLICLVACWVPVTLAADAMGELANGQRASQSSRPAATGFENRPGQNQCFRGVQNQLAYDLRDPSGFASFGLGWTRLFSNSEDLQRVQIGANSCKQQFGASFQRPESLSSFRQQITQPLTGKINPAMLTHINGCQLQTEEHSKKLASRYLYGLGTIERYLSALTDQIASIESTLEGQGRLLGGRDCSYMNGPGAGQDPGLPFPEVRAKCEAYQRCSRLPENVMNEYYQDLQRDYERFIANERNLRQVESDIAGLNQRMFIETTPQDILELRQKTALSAAIKDEQNHLLSQHAFLQPGSEFRRQMDRNFRNAGNPQAVLKEAYKNQRRIDVRLLNGEIIKYQRYVACFRNTTSLPEQCPTPENGDSLERFAIDLRKADEMTGFSFSQDSSPQSLRYQACLAKNSADEVKYREVGQTAAIDIALTAVPVGIAAGTLFRGGRQSHD